MERSILKHLASACVLLCALLSMRAHAQTLDVTKLVVLTSTQAKVVTAFKSFNRGTKESLYELSFTNISGAALRGPVYVTVSGVNPPAVTIKNAIGLTSEGVPYFLVSSTDVAAGAALTQNLVFNNPQNVRFTFTTVAYATAAQRAPLQVQITHPGTLITVGSTPLAVDGTINDESATLTVNGAVISHAGGTFHANVALSEGHNAVIARAVNVRGEEATATLSVSLDLTPPYLTVESPADGAIVTSAVVSVSGLINDIVRGTVSEGQANVTVNGHPAVVANRSYLAQDIPLQEGLNTIRVEGADQVGNTSAKEVQVTYQVPTKSFIALAAGQGQQAQIRQVLPQSLQAKLLSANGQAVAGKPVVFRVSQGDGVVGAGESDEGPAVLVTSDANGLASTRFRLGSRAGSGNQRVSAKAVGFEGEVVFVASATPKPGNKVSVNSGNNQRGATNQPLPLPLVVVVTDEGSNVIEGASVQFAVTAGGGAFDNGQSTISATTDSDGRASAKLTLGSELGLDVQRVTATLAGTTLRAGFTASGLQSGPPGATSISGVVLDNQDHPLPGVTLRVEGTTREAQTDAQGRFRITEAPVGPVRVIADGSTTSVPGEWPTLPYNIVTVAGADNPLAAPVYLVKLDTVHAVTAGAVDREVTLPEVPGFKLTVKAGSVTFPNGDKVGQLSVTPVNVSKIPMAPPNGMQPQFIVTIQPTGARFDPPAPLQLPNVDGHPPGAQVEMYSFDHDLEEFVTIGLGTVSADGTVITSNPGVGVIKAGWHCGSPPDGSGCAASCGPCEVADNNCQCQPNGDPSCGGGGGGGGGDCGPDGPLTSALRSRAARNAAASSVPGDIPHDCKTPVCQNGKVVQVPDPNDDPVDLIAGDCMRPKCFEDPVPDDHDRPADTCKACDDGAIIDQKINDVTTLVEGFTDSIVAFKPGGRIILSFTSNVEATAGCDVQYEWDFHDGTLSHEANPTHIFTAPGNFSPILTVKCAGCDTTEKFSQVTVILPLLDLITPKGDAVSIPVDSGDGQNRYRFSLGLPVLTVQFKVRVIPSTIDLHQIQDRVSFSVDPIGLVFPVWDHPGNPGGRASIVGNNLVATATFTGLPTHNRDFGNKLAELKFNDVTIESARTQVFYEATASQHPGGTPGSPNWFYYYQDQEGGTDYVYDPAPDHCRFEPDTGRIVINEHCYPSVLTLEETIVNGRRRFTGAHGESLSYWRSFIAALGHERGHAATARIWPADQDPDNDLMRTDFEVNVESTDPNNPFTCDPAPGLFLPERFNDAECWAYGSPEHDAANSPLALDATLDWAHPGMQWPATTLQPETKPRDNVR